MENKILKCFICNSPLTKEETDDYFKNAKYCCSGYMCGCYGMPIDPPVCNKCSVEVKE